jgi:P-type Cu+ transporter
MPNSLKDPVCGMDVTTQSRHHMDYQGQAVYFCSAGCLAKFSLEPHKYSAAINSKTTAAPQKAL